MNYNKLPLITAISLLLASAAAWGGHRKWDDEASKRKADYIFLEAIRQSGIDNKDAQYALLEEAYRLNRNDKLVGFDLGFYKLLMTPTTDSAATSKNYALMQAYFDENPADYYNSFMFGRLNEALHRPKDALHVWETLHTIYPEKEEMALRYADALAASPDSAVRSRAITIYDKLEASEGKDLQLTNFKVNYYFQQKDTTNVLNEVESLINAFPRTAECATYAGDVYMAMGNNDRALYHYRHACELDSTNGYAYYSLAYFYNNTGDSIGYDREVFNALQKGSLDVQTKLQLLKSYIETLYSKNIAASDSTAPAPDPRISKLFDKLVDMHPHDADIHNFYCGYLLTLNDYDGAAEELRYALDIDPSDIARWRALVSVDFTAGQSLRARDDVKRALTFFPEDTDLRTMLAVAYQELKEYDKAEDCYKTALATTDEHNYEGRSTILASMGDLAHLRGDSKSAMAYYNSAIESNPGNIMALNNYAYYLACEGVDLEKALGYIEKVMRDEPANSTYADTYAWVLFKLKRYPEALEAIKPLLDDPTTMESAEVLEHAGDIMFMNGEAAKALDYWKRALDKSPDNKELRKKVHHKTIFL